MANKEKPQYYNKTTCKGTLAWAFVTKPKNKYKSTDLEYTVDFLIDPSESEAKAFLEFIDEEVEKAYEKQKAGLIANKKPAAAKQLQKRSPYKDVYDEDGNETGLVKMSFKRDYLFKDKPQKIGLYDSKAKAITDSSIQVGNGTVAKIHFTYRFTESPGGASIGMKTYLNNIQIIELVEYSSGGSKPDFGEEDGFEYEASSDNVFLGEGAEGLDEANETNEF